MISLKCFLKSRFSQSKYVSGDLTKEDLMTNMSETGFPQSHTCFNQLDIPYYRDDDICRRRLIAAAELCGGIDTDNNNFADE